MREGGIDSRERIGVGGGGSKRVMCTFVCNCVEKIWSGDYDNDEEEGKIPKGGGLYPPPFLLFLSLLYNLLHAARPPNSHLHDDHHAQNVSMWGTRENVKPRDTKLSYHKEKCIY